MRDSKSLLYRSRLNFMARLIPQAPPSPRAYAWTGLPTVSCPSELTGTLDHGVTTCPRGSWSRDGLATFSAGESLSIPIRAGCWVPAVPRAPRAKAISGRHPPRRDAQARKADEARCQQDAQASSRRRAERPSSGAATSAHLQRHELRVSVAQGLGKTDDRMGSLEDAVHRVRREQEGARKEQPETQKDTAGLGHSSERASLFPFFRDWSAAG